MGEKLDRINLKLDRLFLVISLNLVGIVLLLLH